MYRFYVGFLIKGTAFACALTGAIVSFYFSHRDIPHTIWSMFLPILVNGGFMTVCLSSLEPARRMQVGHRSLCRAAGMVHSYDLGLLPKLLMIIAVTFAVMTCGLIVLLCVDANGRI